MLLHGGPGAPGYLAPLARELADSFHVLEPFQRRSGDAPLTVRAHVEDVAALLEELPGPKAALVGHSWGAMLALAFAAAYPGRAAALVLVGCGTFDPLARESFQSAVAKRLGPKLLDRLQSLRLEIADPDERLRVMGSLLLPAYSHDPITTEATLARCDGRGYEETWADMMRLQDDGTYPAAFAAIDAPVLMLHGSEDPHPGEPIRASLERYVPRLGYREFERCGHYPWLERHARDEFLDALRGWLAEHLAAV